MTNVDERERDLEVLLSYLLNKPLTSSEVIEAVGVSRNAYYAQKTRGELTTPTNLISAAQHFNLNPLDLLMPYGYVTPDDVMSWYEMTLDPIATTSRREGTALKQQRRDKSSVKSSEQHHYGPGI